MIWQYNHRYSTYKGCTDCEISRGQPKKFELMNNPNEFPIPRYCLPGKEVRRLTDWHDKEYWLCFRDITNATNERTMVATIIPRHCTDYTLRLIYGEKLRGVYAACFLANLNSFVFDYVSRQFVAGTHFSDYITQQLPFLLPNTYEQNLIFNKPVKYWLTSRVLELIYNSWDLEPFAKDCNYHGSPINITEERRHFIRCELDALFFLLYGINREDRGCSIYFGKLLHCET